MIKKLLVIALIIGLINKCLYATDFDRKTSLQVTMENLTKDYLIEPIDYTSNIETTFKTAWSGNQLITIIEKERDRENFLVNLEIPSEDMIFKEDKEPLEEILEPNVFEEGYEGCLGTIHLPKGIISLVQFNKNNNFPSNPTLDDTNKFIRNKYLKKIKLNEQNFNVSTNNYIKENTKILCIKYQHNDTQFGLKNIELRFVPLAKSNKIICYKYVDSVRFNSYQNFNDLVNYSL